MPESAAPEPHNNTLSVLDSTTVYMPGWNQFYNLPAGNVINWPARQSDVHSYPPGAVAGGYVTMYLRVRALERVNM